MPDQIITNMNEACVTADGQNAGMAAVAFYGSTAEDEHNFPLVLIFGREFNNKEAVCRTIQNGPVLFFQKVLLEINVLEA